MIAEGDRHSRGAYTVVLLERGSDVARPPKQNDISPGPGKSGEPDDTEPDDGAMFRAAVGPVRKLPAQAPRPVKPRPAPRARMAERDEAAARSEFRMAMDDALLEAGDPLCWRRDALPPRILQRLRQGRYAVQDELDLHQASLQQAQALLREFLKQARDAEVGCVRIIHGKGLHSPDGTPLLKNLVDQQLRQRAEVLAFHSAPANAGGTGAVLVLLRPRHGQR